MGSKQDAGQKGVTCGEQPSPFSRNVAEHVLELSAYCRALEESGKPRRCPKDRSTLLASVEEGCVGVNYQTVLERACGLDVVDFVEDERFTWYFDAASGALVGALAFDESLPCGAGRYWVGRTARDCDSLGDTACELCLGGSTRDANCPADIVAALPSRACVDDAASTCSCEETEFDPIAHIGAPCSSRCEPCPGGGTCWAECICTLDGTLRWQAICTE